MSDAAKNFDILTTSLGVLHNYFDDLTKLCLDLAKLLDSLAKPFFLCTYASSEFSNVFRYKRHK